MLVDCMSDSFRLHLLAAQHSGRSGIGDRENKQRGIGGRRAKKGVQIHHEVCGEFERAGDMVDGLLCIIAHDERIRSEYFLAVVALLLQAQDPCETKLVIIHDEHDFSPTPILVRVTRSAPDRALIKD